MIKYEKMLFEVLINYIPKISNSLDEISEELKELNYGNRVDIKIKQSTATFLAKEEQYLSPMKSGTVNLPNFLKYGASNRANNTYPPVQPIR